MMTTPTAAMGARRDLYDWRRGRLLVEVVGGILSVRSERTRGTPNRRPVRVFLSHTTELSALRRDGSFVAAAKRAVMDVGDAFVEMGSFVPSEHDPATTSVSMVGLADVYVGIIGLRYGSPVPEEPGLSYTELEFRTASELGMERLIFFIDERPDQVPGAAGPDERQLAFRARPLRSDVTVSRVRTPEELATRLLRALYDLPDLTALPSELSGRALAYARRDLLRRVRQLVVEQERSRGNLAPISLGLVERPSAAYQPHLRLVLRQPDGPDRPLPRDHSISSLFSDLGEQLLILGEPGAGKTRWVSVSA
jgi:Domain of unknown function (DUF4062)